MVSVGEFGGGDLDGSYLGTPTAATATAMNDTEKVKRSHAVTAQAWTQDREPGKEPEVPDGNQSAAPATQISSLEDLRKARARDLRQLFPAGRRTVQ